MKERISVNPNIHFGKPCVTGARITVVNVLELVGEGIPFEEIVRDYYPDLQIEDIQACVRYATLVLQFPFSVVSVRVVRGGEKHGNEGLFL